MRDIRQSFCYSVLCNIRVPILRIEVCFTRPIISLNYRPLLRSIIPTVQGITTKCLLLSNRVGS